jgi:hypothetical protein
MFNGTDFPEESVMVARKPSIEKDNGSMGMVPNRAPSVERILIRLLIIIDLTTLPSSILSSSA